MDSASFTWSRVLEKLGENLTPTAMETWFGECRAVDLSGDTLVVSAPSETVRGILISCYEGLIRAALSDIFSRSTELLIITEEDAARYQSQRQGDRSAHIGEEYTFERFVVGASNRFAHAAAMAVANEETKKFNPLFIWGDSGLGKTHLLYAIRNVIRTRHPEYRVVYVKGEEFLNELIAAIQTGETGENIAFREKYRTADVFLMDDIQIIAGKKAIELEFFNTFNELFETNHQMVFTSDRPPNEMSTLADRLRSRLESGLLADIQPPDYETRMAIIKNKSAQEGYELNEAVQKYIAEKLTANVRQIEGAVKKLTAYETLMGGPLTVATAARLLKDVVKSENEYLPSPELIIEECAKYFTLSPEELRGQSRLKNIALSRQIAMYLIRRLTNLPLKDIGDLFEGRDHSTVLSSVRRIEDSVKKGGEMAQTVKDIMSNISSRQ